MTFRAATLFTLLNLTVPVSAQDMVGVDYAGTIYEFDSYTGVAVPIGVGLPGHNALARDSGGTLWSNGSAVGFTTVMTRVDGVTRTATPAFPVAYTYPSVRGLATGPGTSLFAIVYDHASQASQLVRIDTVSGNVSLVGWTGTGAIQALAMHNGELLGWDLVRGLGVFNTSTGVVTDVAPATGGGDVQWLAVRNDGQLVGGGAEYYAIDRVTGARTILNPSIPYMRGADNARFASPIGAGCPGSTAPVELAVGGNLAPGGFVSTTSVGHAPVSYGAILIGTSRTSYLGVPLPLLLDPLLGTQGCSLHVAPEISRLGVVSASSPPAMSFVFPLPAGLPSATLHLQHVCFEGVPGGVSTSNGMTIHVTN